MSVKFIKLWITISFLGFTRLLLIDFLDLSWLSKFLSISCSAKDNCSKTVIRTSASWIIKSDKTISLILWSLAIFLISSFSYLIFLCRESGASILFETSNKGLSFPAVSNVITFVAFSPSSSKIGKFALIPLVVTKNPCSLFEKFSLFINLLSKNDFPLFLFPITPTTTLSFFLHFSYFSFPSLPHIIFQPPLYNWSNLEKSRIKS